MSGVAEKKKRKRRGYIEDVLIPLLASISLLIGVNRYQGGISSAFFYATVASLAVLIILLTLLSLETIFRFGWSLALKAWRSPYKGKLAIVYFVGLIVVLFAGDFGILPWTFVSPAALTLLTFTLTEVRAYSRNKTPSGSAKPEPSKQATRAGEYHSICDSGPYEVEAGEIQSVLLNVKQGQKIKGHLKEVDRQLFDWYIADEKNMILMENGDRDSFGSIDGGIDENAYRVNRKVPYLARWYLILDAYKKQYSRKVHVNFEPVEGI